jgi:hypothetical protein
MLGQVDDLGELLDRAEVGEVHAQRHLTRNHSPSWLLLLRLGRMTLTTHLPLELLNARINRHTR